MFEITVEKIQNSGDDNKYAPHEIVFEVVRDIYIGSSKKIPK